MYRYMQPNTNCDPKLFNLRYYSTSKKWIKLLKNQSDIFQSSITNTLFMDDMKNNSKMEVTNINVTLKLVLRAL